MPASMRSTNSLRAASKPVSVASILMLTEATMTELPEKPKEHAPAEVDV